MEQIYMFLSSSVLLKHTYGTTGSIEYDLLNPEHRKRSKKKYLGTTGEAQLDIFIPLLFKVTVSLL